MPIQTALFQSTRATKPLRWRLATFRRGARRFSMCQRRHRPFSRLGKSSPLALGNTSLTIANQPDVVRQCQIRVDPGTSAITAGICTVTCGAQVDALSLVTATSTLLNVPFTKGAMTVASAVLTGLTGGTSPKIQIDTTASLAVPIPPNCADVTIIKEITNSADSSANLGTLTTAGNLDTAHRAEFDAYLRRRLRHGFTEPGATLSTALKAAYSRQVVGDLDGALPYYATGLRGAQRPEPWFSVASLLSDRGQHEAALVCAEGARRRPRASRRQQKPRLHPLPDAALRRGADMARGGDRLASVRPRDRL